MIIAEIGQAHDGSLGILHSYIDALADKGVDALKFQTHIAEAESSIYEPFRVKFSYEDDTRFDYWKRMEFTLEQWAGIKKHCEEKRLQFISSPFSNAAVDLLERLNIGCYKIGSGEISNHLLLKKVAGTGKPVILSSGLSNWAELDAAINIFKINNNRVSVLQCFTAYPTTPDQWGLEIIHILKERYAVPAGYSDHSGDIYACLAAATLGAEILEFHVVFHEMMFGPDTKASITIDKVPVLTNGIKQIKKALQASGDKTHTSYHHSLKFAFEKSLAINQPLDKDTFLKFEHLEAKKPKGYGIPAHEYKNIIGKKLLHDMQQWDFLNYDDVE